MSQLERLIRRDRNHPCVFAWSLANEEGSDQGNERGARMATTLRRLARTLDPTRPVTAAMNGGWGAGFSLVVDVQGFNYGDGSQDGSVPCQVSPAPGDGLRSRQHGVDARHLRQRQGARATSARTTSTSRPGRRAPRRGGAPTRRARGWPADLSGPDSTIAASRRRTSGRAPVRTSASWTPAASPRTTSTTTRRGGADQPVLHLFPHWNWAGKEGQDDRRLGAQQPRPGRAARERPEPRRAGDAAQFAPRLEGAVRTRQHRGARLQGRRAGDSSPRARRPEPRPRSSCGLIAHRIEADGEDVAVVEVQVVDAAGRVVPTADNQITFAVSGARQTHRRRQRRPQQP